MGSRAGSYARAVHLDGPRAPEKKHVAMASAALDVDSVIERLLSVRGQPNNRAVQLAEGEIRQLCATARCAHTGIARRQAGA